MITQIPCWLILAGDLNGDEEMSEIAEAKNNQLTAAPTPQQMLMVAVERGTDIAQLEKLMDLQERWEAKEAKKAFSDALAIFQSELSPIIKKRQAHNSKYADIDDIAQSIRPVLERCGLSYRFEQEQKDGFISVSCIVSHRDGFSVSTAMSAPADKSGGKNDIQSMASTVTYLRRYTLTGALGITTGQDDNDGGKPEIETDELLAYNAVLREEWFSICAVKKSLSENDYATAKEAWNEIEEDTMRVLWRAPTKGGIFTTEERAKMKSNEWGSA